MDKNKLEERIKEIKDQIEEHHMPKDKQEEYCVEVDDVDELSNEVQAWDFSPVEDLIYLVAKLEAFREMLNDSKKKRGDN